MATKRASSSKGRPAGSSTRARPRPRPAPAAGGPTRSRPRSPAIGPTGLVELFEQLTVASPDYFALIDRGFRIRYLNPAHCAGRRVTLEQVRGQHLSVVTGERAFAEVLRARYERCFAGEMARFEAWVDYPASGRRFMRATYVPLRGPTGEVEFASVSLHDVTDFKQALADLAHRPTEKRLQRALRTLGECNEALVRATDEAALLQRICDIIVEVGGYRMAWVGLALADEARTVRPAARAGVEAGYLDQAKITWADEERGRGPTGQCLRSGEPVIARHLTSLPEFAPWRDAAVERGFAASAALPLNVEGRTIGALMIYAAEPEAFDDDEEKLLRQLTDDLAFGLGALRANRERERMHAQLMLADRMSSMGMLAAGVAHEINNPLAYAMANLELVARDLPLVLAAEVARAGGQPEVANVPSLEELGERVTQAREGTVRVRDIIRDLKLFSRVDEHSVGLVEVRRVLDASVRMIWNEIKHRGRLVRDYGEMPLVMANEARLGQIVLNLLTNAVQALPERWDDRSEIRVIGRTDEAGRAVIEIQDTGAGIAPEHLASIFEPFFTTKPIGVGTGLGLPICQTIVTALGGEIFVDSMPGQGTTFRVVLPAAAGSPGVARPAPSGPRPGPGRPARILVVDDEAPMCELLRHALAPHEVVTETEGPAALERLRAGERFDLIFCDVMMPQMTGQLFYEQLRALAPAIADRVVFMTGGAFTPGTRDFLLHVANPRLEKPFDLPALLALVRQQLGQA
jgi:PAS domain S-box-containing protein